MTVVGELEVRPARHGDLPALATALGRPTLFADRLNRQRADLGLLLAAWLDGGPIGSVYLWWEPAEEPEIRQHLPGVPLLMQLEVLAGHRNRQVGSSLLVAAEHVLARRGHRRAALAVEVSNEAAARLYARHGFRQWDRPPVLCHTHEDLRAGGGPATELCHILVKTLAPTPA